MTGKKNPENNQGNGPENTNENNPSGEQESITALEKAQELVLQAFEAPTQKAAVSLAREALKISPDCSDAYIILALNYAKSQKEAVHYFQAGVAASERAIGPELFEKLKGSFWKDPRTQAYLRVREGLSLCLWELAKFQESIDHLKAILVLNPADDQGVRYLLAAHLMEVGQIEDLKKLMELYPEESVEWLYTRALILFCEKGDSPEANQALSEAAKFNPQVIPFLTLRKKLPEKIEDYLNPDEKTEAALFTVEYSLGWHRIAGAIDWLKTRYPARTKNAAVKPAVEGVPDVFINAFETANKTTSLKEKGEEIYVLKVGLKLAPGIWRKIEIKGNQSLHTLHKTLVSAFERDDDHLYAFFMNNKAWDSSAEFGPPYGETEAQDSTRAKLNKFGLKPRSKFLYIFDFGDEWEHPITVLEIKQETPKGKYPRVIESKGEAPPQYPDGEDDFDEEEDSEE